MLENVTPFGRVVIGLAALCTLIGLGFLATRPAFTTAGPYSSAQARQVQAETTFRAWLAGDTAMLTQLAGLTAAQLLLARAPGDEHWPAAPRCEDTPDGTDCTWATEEARLRLRVTDEAPRPAVQDIAFTAPAEAIAAWPFTTEDAGHETQARVDEGHLAWLRTPETVIEAFVLFALGWEHPIVQPTTETQRFRVIERQTGVTVDIEVTQPIGNGGDGIWAITHLTTPAE